MLQERVGSENLETKTERRKEGQDCVVKSKESQTRRDMKLVMKEGELAGNLGTKRD